MKKKILFIVTVIVLLLCSGCNNEVSEEKLLNIDFSIEKNEAKLSSYDTKNPVVAMYIENYGAIVIELYS